MTPESPARPRVREYLLGVAAVAASTALCGALSPYLPRADLDMISLLGLVAVSTQLGLVPSLFTAALTALSFDFFFIPPSFSFRPGDLSGAFTLAVMTIVAGVISGLGERTRRHQVAVNARDVQIETERLRSSLLSAVSHDLKTPLAAIFGAGTELLRDGVRLEQASRVELVSVIVEESERLNLLLTNLLDVARLNAGTIQANKRPEPLEEVVEAALGRLRGRLGSRSISTHIPREIPMIPMDPVLLQQVFVNLFENAIRYTPDGSPLEVEASREAANAVVEVRDRGPGVDDSDRTRLFERFYRSQGQKGDGGLGLGLTICRAIVNAHGGDIGIANRDGGGAVVRFLLPLSSAAPFDTRELP